MIRISYSLAAPKSNLESITHEHIMEAILALFMTIASLCHSKKRNQIVESPDHCWVFRKKSKLFINKILFFQKAAVKVLPCKLLTSQKWNDRKFKNQG